MHSTLQQQQTTMNMGSFTTLPRRTLAPHQNNIQRLDVQCNASRKRRTQASAVHPSSAADRLSGLLLRGAPVQPSIAGEEFPLRLDVADTVEQLERSLQATPVFAEPITKRKRGRKPKSTAVPARQGCSLFDAPSRGRLSTIKSTKTDGAATSTIAPSGTDSSVGAARRSKGGVDKPRRGKGKTGVKKAKDVVLATGTQFDMDAEVVRAIGTRLHRHRAEIKTSTYVVVVVVLGFLFVRCMYASCVVSTPTGRPVLMPRHCFCATLPTQWCSPAAMNVHWLAWCSMELQHARQSQNCKRRWVGFLRMMKSLPMLVCHTTCSLTLYMPSLSRPGNCWYR